MESSYIFRYEKDNNILGYHIDTLCNYGSRESAKIYNTISGEIKAQEIQNTIQWYVELGIKELVGINVIPEKIDSK